MSDIGGVIGAFIVGVAVGCAYLFLAGDLASPPAPPPAAVLQPSGGTPQDPSVQAQPVSARSPSDAGPAPEAVAIASVDAGQADAAPAQASAPAVVDAGSNVAKAPPTPPSVPQLPRAAFGSFLISGVGGTVRVDASDKSQKAARVALPLHKAEGKLTVKSPDGVWTIDIKYRSEGQALRASIDSSPMALIGAGGQVATHLDVPVTKAPLKVDFNGGAVGKYSLLLQYMK
jgi:hypothetical protein